MKNNFYQYHLIVREIGNSMNNSGETTRKEVLVRLIRLKINRFFKLILILSFISLLFTGCEAEGEEEANISLEETYSGNHFAIDYPEDWEEVNLLHDGIEIGDIFQIGSDLSKFVIMVQEDVHFSPDELMNFEELKAVTPGFELIEEKEVELDGHEAFAYIFTGKDEEGNTVKYSQIITVKDNNAYTINFHAEKEYFEKEIAIAEKMVDSFRFE